MRATSRRQAWLTAILIAAALVLDVSMHLYPLRLVILDVERIDGAGVPSAAAMRFPEGTALLSVRTECANGGCWSLFTVRPPAGADRVAFEGIYLVDRGRMDGTLWDPRPITVSAEEFGNDVWVVRGDYWSDSSWRPRS
jgi:hypothetical protein